MRISICHYSFHRTWESKNWTCERLAEEVKSLGVDGVDFHAGLLGNTAEASARINSALDKTGLILSGLSLSNDFNQENPAALREQIDATVRWMRVAAEVGAPVSRIFGGHVGDRSDSAVLAQAFSRVIDGLGEVVREAEKLGVILALENHGGLPCTGEEQVQVIENIGSKNLRATIDVGNYMQGGQEAHQGTAIAAELASYVHFKDFRKKASDKASAPWSLEPVVLGEGDVDHHQCLKELRKAGYDGFIAIEYEGTDDEKTGVPRSVEYTKKLIKDFR